MKFDYIIQNPPYKNGLHLEFFKIGLNNIKNTGKMVIIEPSSWLIKFNKTHKTKIFNELKTELKNHVKSIIIENLNKEFNIGLYTPLSITVIDLNKTNELIDFTCCGKYSKVNSIYNCNLIGNYKLVNSIIDKCNNYKDKFINHIYNKNSKIDNNTYFAKYLNIIGRAFCGDPRWTDAWFRNGLYCAPSYFPAIDDRVEISKTPHMVLKTGRTYSNPAFTDKVANNIYGPFEQLENFIYNVYNTNIFPFINICLITDQTNNSKNYLPFIADKKYTNEEIYKLLNITEEEIEFINSVLKKYNKNSEWFVRLMYGPYWKKYCDKF